MSTIFRLESGLIFDDPFNGLDPRWEISPSNSYSVNPDTSKLILEHSGEEGTKALFPVPQQEGQLAFEVTSTYTPTEVGDEGGILIWNSAVNKLEFLESEDIYKQDEYTRLRAVKRGSLWTFFAKRSSGWELFDSSLIEPHMLGMVLKGGNNENFKPMTMDRAVLCKGTSITVGNLSEGYFVELRDEAGKSVGVQQIVPNSYGGVELPLPSLPFKGHINVWDKPGTHLNPALGNHDLNPKVDIVFIVDTSGSMASSIQNVKDNINSFTNILKDRGFDAQLAYVKSSRNRSPLLPVEKFLFEVETDGGSWENLAWEQITNEEWGGFSYIDEFREGANKHFILLTDTFISATYTDEMITRLNENNIILSVIHNLKDSDYTVPVEATNGVEGDIQSANFNEEMGVIAKKVIESSESRLLGFTSEPIEMYGGDVYLMGTDVVIHWNEEELNSNEVTHLGPMKFNMIEEQMQVYNPTTGNVREDVTIYVQQYEEEFGWNWATVCSDDGTGKPIKDSAAKSVYLGDLSPGEAKPFWVLVQRDMANFSRKPTHFRFEIEHF